MRATAARALARRVLMALDPRERPGSRGYQTGPIFCHDSGSGMAINDINDKGRDINNDHQRGTHNASVLTLYTEIQQQKKLR